MDRTYDFGKNFKMHKIFGKRNKNMIKPAIKKPKTNTSVIPRVSTKTIGSYIKDQVRTT